MGATSLPRNVGRAAALEQRITSANAGSIRGRRVIEGANGPTTPEADDILADRGILVVPDGIANAGGVTVSYFRGSCGACIPDRRALLSVIYTEK